MLYSSGTTGQPKGIMRPPARRGSRMASLLCTAFLIRMFGFREGMTYLNPAPLYHSAPHGERVDRAAPRGDAVIMEHFDAEQWLATWWNATG